MRIGDVLVSFSTGRGQVLVNFHRKGHYAISPPSRYIPALASSEDHSVTRSVSQDISTRHYVGAGLLLSSLDLIHSYKAMQPRVGGSGSLGSWTGQEDGCVTASNEAAMENQSKNSRCGGLVFC